MINIVEDIARIMEYDKSHNVEVVINTNGVTIFLNEKNYDTSIPIKYDCSDGIYIDNKKQNGVIGICAINIIKNIMEYLEDHIGELDEVCDKCDWSGRQSEN